MNNDEKKSEIHDENEFESDKDELESIIKELETMDNISIKKKMKTLIKNDQTIKVKKCLFALKQIDLKQTKEFETNGKQKTLDFNLILNDNNGEQPLIVRATNKNNYDIVDALISYNVCIYIFTYLRIRNAYHGALQPKLFFFYCFCKT